MYSAQTQRIVVVDVYDDQSPPPLLSPKRCDDFVTVLKVDDPLPPSNFVTVLQVDPAEVRDEHVEEVSIYRLPGERLGMALKFEGGVNVNDTVSRVFIQSINQDSPAARARCQLFPLKEGDEILKIDDKEVSSMTRIDCVSVLRDAPVCIRLFVRHQPKDSPFLNGVVNGQPEVQQTKKKGHPPPVPPRKTSYITREDKAVEGVRDIVQRLEMQQNAVVKRPSQPPPLPPRRPRTEMPDDFQPADKANFPGSTVSMRLPGWEELMHRRAERLDREESPVLADVTVDLLADEELHYIESESDDTGSSVSTVIEKFSRGSTANSSFSEHVHSLERPAPFDLKQVLSPFERLERELDGEDGEQQNFRKIFAYDEGPLDVAIEPPVSFQDCNAGQEDFSTAMSPPGDSGFSELMEEEQNTESKDQGEEVPLTSNKPDEGESEQPLSLVNASPDENDDFEMLESLFSKNNDADADKLDAEVLQVVPSSQTPPNKPDTIDGITHPDIPVDKTARIIEERAIKKEKTHDGQSESKISKSESDEAPPLPTLKRKSPEDSSSPETNKKVHASSAEKRHSPALKKNPADNVQGETCKKSKQTKSRDPQPNKSSTSPESNPPVSPASLARSKIPRPTFPTSPLSTTTFSERNHFTFDKKSKMLPAESVETPPNAEERSRPTTTSKFGFDNRKNVYKKKRTKDGAKGGISAPAQEKTKPLSTPDNQPSAPKDPPKKEDEPVQMKEQADEPSPEFHQSLESVEKEKLEDKKSEDDPLENIFDEVVSGHDDVHQFRVEVGVTNEKERHFLCSDSYLDESTFAWNLSRWPLQDVPEEEEPADEVSQKVQDVSQESPPPPLLQKTDELLLEANVQEVSCLSETTVDGGSKKIEKASEKEDDEAEETLQPTTSLEEVALAAESSHEQQEDAIQLEEIAGEDLETTEQAVKERKKSSEESETSESSTESDACSVLEASVQAKDSSANARLPSANQEEHVNCAMELLRSVERQSGIFEDSLIPPTFSRLPPDGHEFPPSYSEPPLLSPESKIENMPSIDEPFSRPKVCELDKPLATIPSWKSEENLLNARKLGVYGRDQSISVKDRIAMFSKDSEPSRPVVNGYISKAVPSAADSLDNSYEEPPVLQRNNKWHSMISLPTEDSQKPVPTSTSSTEDLLKPLKDFPEFARPKTVSSYPETQLTNHRRYSSPFLRNGDDLKKPSSTLFSLLESRKQNAKKLKGLVIPEKPSTVSGVLKPLPTILSCNALLRHDDRKPDVMEQNARNRSFSMVATESQWKLGFTAPVTRQQVQPAYKCHSMDLPRTPVSSSVSPTPPSSLTSPLSPPPSSPSSICSSNTSSSCGTQKQVFQFSLSHSKPVTPTLPEKPIMSPVPLSTSSSDYEADNSEMSIPAMKDDIVASPPPVPKKAPPPPPVLSQPVAEKQEFFDETSVAESYTSMVNGVCPKECEEESQTEQQSKTAVERLDSLVGLSAFVTEEKTDDAKLRPSGGIHLQNGTDNDFVVPKSESRSFWENGLSKTTESEDDDNHSVSSQRTEDSRQTADDSLSDAPSDSLSVDPEFKPRRISQQQTVLRTYKDSADSVKNFRALAEKWEQRAGEETKTTHPVLARKDSGKQSSVDGTMKLPPSLMPRPADAPVADRRRSVLEQVDDQFPRSRSRSELHQSRLTNGEPITNGPITNGYLKKSPINGVTEAKNWMNLSRSISSMSINSPTSSVFSRNSRSVSVSDIRKAFENSSQQNGTAPAKVNGTTTAGPQRRSSEDRSVLKEPALAKGTLVEHRRFSSVDSTDSGTSTPGSLGMSSGRGDLYGSVNSLASTGSLISSQELQQLIDEANLSLEESGSKEIVVVVLHKDIPAGGIGVTLAGGSDYETKEITVHKIITGSLADRDGRIRKGDRIMSINGRSVKGVTHREALDILKSPRAEVVLVISREKTDDLLDVATRKDKGHAPTAPVIPTANENTSPARAPAEHVQDKAVIPTSGNVTHLFLFKDGSGLGFSLEGGKDSPFGDKPLTVKRIFKGGAADREGQLKMGDEIMTLNTQAVANMTRTEAWNYMKKLPDGQVTVAIRKCI